VNVCVAGLWHLGITTAACLAEGGHHVVGFDPDTSVIETLNGGGLPIVEPGLDELMRAGLESSRLAFSADSSEALQGADVVWMTYDVGIGAAGRSTVFEQAEMLGPDLSEGALVVISSQVPVGTTREVERLFSARSPGRDITVAYSPENLRVGAAVESFLRPGRVIAGVGGESSRTRVAELFAPFTSSIVWMSVESAEMTKHALNAFLATSVSFINEIADVCEVVGADAAEVEQGLKSERRIGGEAYLTPGSAYAGGTLDRDVQNLLGVAREHGLPAHLLSGTAAANDAHRDWTFRMLQARLGSLRGCRIAIWGLATKPGSDIVVASASVELCVRLHHAGAEVVAFDPAVRQAPPELEGAASFASTPLAAAHGASALVVATPCPEFRAVPPDAVTAAMDRPLVIDPGRYLQASLASAKIEYCAVGQGDLADTHATPLRRAEPPSPATPDRRSLGGYVCVVSGSSRGLGREIAGALARRGASIALCARHADAVLGVADELRAAHGVPVHAGVLDVTDRHAVSEWAESTLQSVGAPDVLINNAGVLGPVGRLDQLDLGDWRQALDINLVGAATLSAAFLPSMIERRRGAIINLSGGGIGGPRPPGYMSAYTTAKAGLVVLTETLGEELAPFKIRVYAVAPGAMATQLMRPVLDAGPEAAGARLYELTRQIYDPASPAPTQLPSELAELLVFLVTERPEWLSGKLLSAKWDTLQSLQHGEGDQEPSRFNLRRIDGVLYDERRPGAGGSSDAR
jgi:UDPglucose 6-dehydrogenase